MSGQKLQRFISSNRFGECIKEQTRFVNRCGYKLYQLNQLLYFEVRKFVIYSALYKTLEKVVGTHTYLTH